MIGIKLFISEKTKIGISRHLYNEKKNMIRDNHGTVTSFIILNVRVEQQ